MPTNKNTGNIKKAGALIFKDNKFLIVKPNDRPYFINPGGKYEKGESAEDCLRRELKEELQVEVVSMKHYKNYEIDKAAHSDNKLTLELYIVEIKGEPKPSAEIGELVWLSKEDFNSKKFNLAPSFSKIVPDLIKDGLLQ